jgi:hypothetical protein
MNAKLVKRNIPPARENQNDRFRVKYNDRSEFDILQVQITHMADGTVHNYFFRPEVLPDKDSIHFSTAMENGKLTIIWFGANPFKSN